MPDKKILYKILIHGRVQGVGFRQACSKEARFLGITGYVKNRPDGTVYSEAEGTYEQLSALTNWCQKGPGYGSVDSVEVETSEPLGYTTFSVKY